MGTEARQRSRTIVVRVTPQEEAAIRKRAKAHGSVSAYGRAAMLDGPKVTPKASPDSSLLAELVALRGQLRHSFGLQKAYFTGESGVPVASAKRHEPQIVEIQRLLTDAIHRVDEAIGKAAKA